MDSQNIQQSLKQFLMEQLEGDFEDEEEQLMQIINRLKQSKDLLMTFKSILSDYGKIGTQLKMIIKTFKETVFYLNNLKVQNQNHQLIPTIDNYKKQIILLKELSFDMKRMLKSNINTQFHQYKLYEIIMESLVAKYDILKNEYKNMTSREVRSINTIKQILKQILSQIQKQGRINNEIFKCISDIQNNKGNLLDHLFTFKKQLNPIDVMDLERLIQKNKNAEAQLKDKSIILFIGDTGSGKTTTILSLLGFRMTKKKLKGMTWVTTTQRLTDQKLKLLYSSPELKSITRYPLAVLPLERLDKNEQIWFVDTPGFGDSAGTEVDLANGIGTIKAIKGCKNVRIAIVISKQSWGTKGKGIRSLAKLLGDIFNNYQKVKNSVIYIFNRFTVDESMELHSAIENLIQNPSQEDKTNQNLMSLYNDLLIKTQNYQDIINFDPLITDQYKRVLKMIVKLKKLENPSDAFSFSFTQKTLNNIKKQCSIFEKMIKYHYQFSNYQIVKFYYNNYKLFYQLVDRQDIKNGFTNITNDLENLIKQYFDKVQLKFNDRLARNLLKKGDILEYQQKIKQAEKYQCLQDCIKIIRKEDLQLNLINQVSSLIERLLVKEYFQKQTLESILFLNQNFKIEGYKQLLQKIDNKIDECKQIISKNFEDQNYQECAKYLNHIKVKFQLKGYVNKNFLYEREFKKIQLQISQKILKWSEEYIQDFNSLNRDKIQRMNDLQKNLNDVKICYPLMKVLDKQASKIDEKIQTIKPLVLQKVNKQFTELHQLLDEKNIEGIQNKILQKFNIFGIYKALNCISSQIKLKLNMINERIKTYLKNQTDVLDQFCNIIENKSYHQNSIKLKFLLAKLDKTIQGVNNFLPFRNDQQKNKQYKELCARSLKNLNQYFIDQGCFISQLRITNNMDKQQIILIINSLKGIIEQIKVLEKSKNLFEIKLLVQLKSNLNTFFDRVLESSKKTLNGFRIAIKKQTSIKLVKIENEFNFLSIFSETTLKVQSQELSKEYQLELKNLKEFITKEIQKNLKTLNNDKLEDQMIYTLTRDIKKYFEYIVILKNSCPNICQVCFQDDLEKFYQEILAFLHNRYQSYEKYWNIFKNQNNNLPLNKLITLCSNHLIFDKYMDDKHKFQKLSQEIKKQIEKKFTRTVSEINNYFSKNDFLNLQSIFYRLSNDKSPAGKKTYREGQQFLINKINEIFNSLPKLHLEFQMNRQDYFLSSDEISKIEYIFNIKNHVSIFIKEFQQYKKVQENTKSFCTLIKKVILENITKIKGNIDNYELEDALLNCDNLKKTQTIMRIISEKQKNLLQEEHQKLIKQINKKIEVIQNTFLRTHTLNINDEFVKIYKATLEIVSINKIKKLKEQIDNKVKIYFQQMLKSFCEQTNLEQQAIKKAEIKNQLRKLPKLLSQSQTNIFNAYENQVSKNHSQMQKDLCLIFQQGNQQVIYEKLKHFQKIKNHSCIELILMRYENNLKKISQRIANAKKLQQNLKGVEQIIQLWKNYENHPGIAKISQNYIQIIICLTQQNINSTIKKFWQYYEKVQFNQILLLLGEIFEISKKYSSLKQVKSVLKYINQKYKHIFAFIYQQISISINNLKQEQIFEEEKISRQVVQSLKKLFQIKDLYFVLVQNIQDIDPSLINPIKQKSKYNINQKIRRFFAKINQINIFLQQFSLSMLLYYDKNVKAQELKKLKINLLIVKQYGGIYSQLKKQEIKNQQYYTKKIQNQIKEIFTQCSRLINTIQCLKTQNQYEKLNQQIQILQKYQEIFHINKFIEVIKKSFNQKIISTTQQIPKLVNELLKMIKNYSDNKNKSILRQREDQIRNHYKKLIQQKKMRLETRIKNATSQEQKQHISIIITTQISDLQKQENQQSQKIIQQESVILISNNHLYEKRTTEKNNLIADVLIFLKSIETYIPMERDHCKSQIAKILKQYNSKLQKNNLKNLANAIQNKNGLSSYRLLSQLPEFQKFIMKNNNKKFQINKIDEILKNCDFDIKKNQSFQILYDAYNTEYQKLLTEYADFKQSTVDKILSNMKQKITVLKEQYKLSRTHEGNLLIADIVSIWSILNSVQIQNKIEYRLTPHPAQIMAVFYLLGIGDSTTKYSIANRAAEIEAGEGKSLILAIVSCYFGLLGYQVSIVCQTEDLYLRDSKAFKQLYTKIGIDESVKYGTINKIIQQNHLSTNLQLMNQKIQQQNKSITDKIKDKIIDILNLNDKKKQKIQTNQKILLIDQIQTLFESEFYIGVYRPYVTFKHLCIQNLFTYIWTFKQQINTQQIEKSKQFKECKQFFPYLESILKNHIRDMLYCAKNWQHKYIVSDGKITYTKQSKMTNELLYGYKSCFAYCHQVNRGKITQNTKNQYLYIMVTYDELLYSDLLINFKYILAVTQSYNKVKLLDKFYRINNCQIIPSASGKSKRIQKPIILTNKDLFYDQIVKQINLTLIQNRSVLVFFSNSIEANHFFYSQRYCDLREKCNNLLLQELSEDQKIFRINKSTKPGMVTILTSIFAKGTDFVLSDQKLIENGGLHIIQTFISTSMIEQIQIKGRCARQGDKGSYRLILVEEQLQKLQINIQQINQLKKKKLDSIQQNKSLVALINDKRTRYMEKLYQNFNSVRFRLNQDKLTKQKTKSANIFQKILSYNTFPSIFFNQHKIILGLDVTASMSHTLEQIKRILPIFMENLIRILKSQNLALQIFVYRNYGDHASILIQKSLFQTKPEPLLKFLNKITAAGGYGSKQANELFYQHLNQNFFHQAILIGGAQQNSPQEVINKRLYFGQNYWLKNSISQVFGHKQLQKIQQKGLPIHCIPTINDRPIRQYFRKISESTGGKFMSNYEDSYGSDNSLLSFLLDSIQQYYGNKSNVKRIK